MRVAYVSPFPPATSGIADYSTSLVPALVRDGLDVTLFYEGEVAPAREVDPERRALPARELRRHSGEHDLVLYQLGNSAPHHAEAFRTLAEVPGVVVLHEYMLHHLIRAMTLDSGDPSAYVEEMRYCAGESGRRAAQRLLDTHRPVDVWRFPLFERVVDRSLGVLVHSEFARRRVLASRAGARVGVVPFPVDVDKVAPPSAPEKASARRELGLEEGSFVLGSFGLVTPFKRLEPALAAFAAFRGQRPSARFLVCGEVSPHYDLTGRLAEIGGEGVTVTGRLAPPRFRAAICACDAAVNLRHPTGGETSASLLELLAAGMPTIVSDLGSFAELPDGTVAKVAIDEVESAHLLELLRRLESDRGLRTSLGSAARRHVVRENAVERSAAGYLAFLEEVARSGAAVEPATPPLAPGGADPRWALVSSIGADAADLGIDERDREALGAIADELAAVGWAPPGKAV